MRNVGMLAVAVMVLAGVYGLPAVLADDSPATDAAKDSTAAAADGTAADASKTDGDKEKDIESVWGDLLNGSGWVTFGTTFVHTSGNDHRFMEQEWMDDNFLYGLHSFGYATRADSMQLSVTGRAVSPDDYGIRIEGEKKGSMFFDVYFDQFPSYSDSTGFYYPFAPFIYELDHDLILRRRSAGGRIGWGDRRGDHLIVRFEHWQREGLRAVFEGSEVEDTGLGLTRKSYPTITDIDQQRNTIGLDISKRVGRFRIKTGVEVQDYHGKNDTPDLRFVDGAYDELRSSFGRTDWTQFTPYFETYGDLIEDILRWELRMHYRYIDTDAARQAAEFDGALDTLTWNEHEGYVNEALVNTRLIYTPNDRTTVFGGFGYKFEDADHESFDREDNGGPDGVLDDITRYRSDDNRSTWMINGGASHEILSWLIAKIEGRWEHGELSRDWRTMELLGGTDMLRYRADSDFDKAQYIASLTAKPRRDLKIVGRWKQKFVDSDVDLKEDTENGVYELDPPGFTRDNDRQMNEWSLLTQYRPNTYWMASHKLIGRITDFKVRTQPAENVGSQTDIINSMSLTFTPCDAFSVTGSGGIQRFLARTRASNVVDTAVPNYDGDSYYWGVDVDCDVTEKVLLSGGVYRTVATSMFDYAATDVSAGVKYLLNNTWTVEFGYGFTALDEHGNANLGDYKGHTFGLKATARF